MATNEDLLKWRKQLKALKAERGELGAKLEASQRPLDKLDGQIEAARN